MRVQSVEGLQRLEHLWDLSLSGSPITDDGLRKVKLMKSLLWLDVRYTRITDVGVGYISEAHGLTHLVLGDNNISDAGIQSLRRLTNLEQLEIDKTAATDSGVLALANLAKLERLSIGDTAVTEAARDRILGQDGRPRRAGSSLVRRGPQPGPPPHAGFRSAKAGTGNT